MLLKKQCPRCGKIKFRLLDYSFFGYDGWCDDCVLLRRVAEKELIEELETKDDLLNMEIYRAKLDKMKNELRNNYIGLLNKWKKELNDDKDSWRDNLEEY